VIVDCVQTLIFVWNRFGDEYTTLKARVLKTLCEATAADKPLPTIFGGIVAVTLFGPKAIDAFLVPLFIPYFTKWEESLKTVNDLEKRLELQECQQAIMVRKVSACCVCILDSGLPMLIVHFTGGIGRVLATSQSRGTGCPDQL
jgi:hypothetical protein